MRVRDTSQHLARSSSRGAPEQAQLSVGCHAEWLAGWQGSLVHSSLFDREGDCPSIGHRHILIDAFENVEFSGLSVPSESPNMAYPPMLEDRDPLAAGKGRTFKLVTYLTRKCCPTTGCIPFLPDCEIAIRVKHQYKWTRKMSRLQTEKKEHMSKLFVLTNMYQCVCLRLDPWQPKYKARSQSCKWHKDPAPWPGLW